MKPDQNAQVRHNKQAHDAVASSYERKHTEIFNPTEQARIALVLEGAMVRISPFGRGSFRPRFWRWDRKCDRPLVEVGGHGYRRRCFTEKLGGLEKQLFGLSLIHIS